jgi:hypothetical protein
MALTLEEYGRKRSHLELLQGEFRRLAFRYPPLCHERFFSPQHVTYDGWKAFVASRPAKSKWEYWHGPRDGEWFGRFFGKPQGFRDFQNLCYSLSMLFPDWSSAMTDWMEVVHTIAETRPSPLLNVSRYIWELPMDSVEDEEEEENNEWHTSMVTQRILGSTAFGAGPGNIRARYPNHPAQRILRFNVFTSSVAAIQVIMNPGLVIPEGESYEELPIVLLPPQQPEPESIASKKGVGLLEGPPYGFQQSGDTWLLHFTSNDDTKEGIFQHRKGFSYYQQLLMSPKSTISCSDLDPKPGTADMAAGSLMELQDFLEEGESLGDFANLGLISEAGADEKGMTLVNELIKSREQLEIQVAGETDESVKSELKNKLKRLTEIVNIVRRQISYNEKDIQAFQRVKKAMDDCRKVLRDHGMKDLANHLSQSVQRIGWAFRYDPAPQPNWKF